MVSIALVRLGSMDVFVKIQQHHVRTVHVKIKAPALTRIEHTCVFVHLDLPAQTVT